MFADHRFVPARPALAAAFGLAVLVSACAVEPPRQADAAPAAGAPLAVASAVPPAPSPTSAAPQPPASEPPAPARAEPPSPAAPTLPTPVQLVDLLRTRPPAELMSHLEALLLAREAGYRVLATFFELSERDSKPQLMLLLHDPVYVYGLLRLASHHPDATADLARFLLEATRGQPKALIRREAYRFLPVFIRQHAGRHVELRRALEADIDFQLRAGGFYLFDILAALTALPYEPPVEAMAQVLRNYETTESHRMAIAYLARRGDPGTQALVSYVKEVKDLSRARVVEVFQELALVEQDQDRGIVRSFFADERPPIRRAALLGYFTYPRGADSIPLLLDYLNSDAPVNLKQSMIVFLRQKNQHLIVELARLTEDVHDERLRAILERAAAPRKSKDGGSKDGGAAAEPAAKPAERGK